MRQNESAELATVHSEIVGCTKCELHKSRKNAVPGEGPADAKIMFVGEGPGQNEDELGRPFVGAAGRLLTELLESIGLSRSEVFITNIVKCRPPGNRAPRKPEIEACNPYLMSQIRLIKPRIVCALGTPAIATLLRRTILCHQSAWKTNVQRRLYRSANVSSRGRTIRRESQGSAGIRL
jgi:DNA polymerase